MHLFYAGHKQCLRKQLAQFKHFVLQIQNYNFLNTHEPGQHKGTA